MFFGKSYLLLQVLGKDTPISLDWSARHPGPPTNSLDVELFNVGGFLTHGDHALDTVADFPAVVEHRLVPAGARSEGKRLLKGGARSIWAPASLEGRHVGQAGVGVVCLRGTPISFPTLSSLVGFSGVICLLLVVVWFVVYGFQGASTDPEKLRPTEKQLDPVLCELALVASG